MDIFSAKTIISPPSAAQSYITPDIFSALFSRFSLQLARNLVDSSLLEFLKVGTPRLIKYLAEIPPGN